MLPSRRQAAPAVLFLGALVAGAALPSAPSGGIVKTEYKRFTIQPGPPPEVTFFATGECIGKIEPCG